VTAQHQRRTERDEVAGDMGDKQTAQAEEAHGIDEATVEREQGSNREATAELEHRWSFFSRSLPRKGLSPLYP
jgi:hypothetical protein